MIQHGDLVRFKKADISLSVLAVHRHQKLRRIQMERVFNRDFQLLHHQDQIAFPYGIFPAVNQGDILAILLQVNVNGIPGRKRIRVGIVVALHHDIVVIQ
jgi:hypothetical protein